MRRTMGDPDYEYQPWSEERRRAASVAAKKRIRQRKKMENRCDVRCPDGGDCHAFQLGLPPCRGAAISSSPEVASLPGTTLGGSPYRAMLHRSVFGYAARGSTTRREGGTIKSFDEPPYRRSRSVFWTLDIATWSAPPARCAKGLSPSPPSGRRRSRPRRSAAGSTTPWACRA
jgi:hypothetical protein